jgi:AcrR family transcriptional regulator
MTTNLDEHVLDAGRRALRRFGFQALTTERIAGEAGLSRVTLHRRGVSKDVILGALTARAIETYREALWPALTGPGTGAERLEAALVALCEVAEDNLELLMALGSQTDAVFHEEGQEDVLTRGVFTEPLERLLRDGAADGTLRRVDPIEAATLVFNLVGWTYIHLRRGHRWDPDRARSNVIELAVKGLTP